MRAVELRELLARRELRLRRDLGQNYLLDDELADRLVAAAGVVVGDAVIEVGAGLGVLTRALARAGARIIAIEIDAGIVRALEEESLLPEGVVLRHADALKLDWPQLVDEARDAAPTRAVRVVANLPYSAATPLLRILLDQRGALADWSVMLQREVARRICAEVGSRDYGSFAVLHALAVDVGRAIDVPPHVFFPPPDVHSSFVRLTPRAQPLLEGDELAAVERVVRAAFGKRRKTLSNALRGLPGATPEQVAAALGEAGIDPGLRAERVAAADWLVFARALAAATARPS